MTLDAAQTVVRSAVDLFLAPWPTAAPAVADLDDSAALLAAGWNHLGWIHEDAPSLDGFEGEVTELYGANSISPARIIVRRRRPMIVFGMLQWNATTLGLYLPGSSYDEPTEVLTVPETISVTDQSLLITVQDGSDYKGIWVDHVNVRGSGALEFPGEDFSSLPVTADILSATDPLDAMEFIGIPLEGSEESESS